MMTDKFPKQGQRVRIHLLDQPGSEINGDFQGMDQGFVWVVCNGRNVLVPNTQIRTIEE